MRLLTIVLTMFAAFVLLGNSYAIYNAPFISGDEERDTSALRPIIITQNVKVDPIMNNANPVFFVRDILVRIPGLMRKDSAQVCTIEVGINSSNVRDLKTDSTYTVIVIDVEPLRQMSMESIQKSRDYWSHHQPQMTQRQLPNNLLPEPPQPLKHVEINADTLRYCAMFKTTLKLVGGKLPLTKGQVKGHVVLTFTATYVDTMGVTHRHSKTQPIQIAN